MTDEEILAGGIFNLSLKSNKMIKRKKGVLGKQLAKGISKAPTMDKNNNYLCPTCGIVVGFFDDEENWNLDNYCSHCGQKIGMEE